MLCLLSIGCIQKQQKSSNSRTPKLSSHNGTYLVYKVIDKSSVEQMGAMLKNKYSNGTFIIAFTERYVTLKETENSQPIALARDHPERTYKDETYITSFIKEADSVEIDLTLTTGVRDTILNIYVTPTKQPEFNGSYMPPYGKIDCYLSRVK